MKRVLLQSALALGVLLLAVIAVAVVLLLWAARSESGLQFVWQRVVPRLPAGISVAAVEGRLAGPLVLEGIAVDTDTLAVRVERVELHWRPRSLLGRVVYVERLDVRGVEVVQLPVEQPPAPSEPFRLPGSIELPVDVEVAAASLAGLEFRASPSAEPYTVERAAFAANLSATAFELREIEVRGPLFDMTGAASVVPRGAYETSAQLDWAVRPGDYPEARGNTRVSGDLDVLTIEQRVEPPYDARLEVRVQDALTALRLDGEAVLALQPAAFGVEQAPAERVDAALSFGGPLDALDVTGSVTFTGGDADGVAVELAVQYAGTAVEIRMLDVVRAGSSMALQASGRAAVGGEQPVLELDMTWTDLQWPLDGEPQVASDAGSLTLTGTPEDYAIVLEGALALADGTNGNVRVSGTGDAEALALDEVDIDALGGTIAGRAQARWAPSVSGSVELEGTRLDPGVVLREWQGQIDARLGADATIDNESVSVELHELQADGVLQDRPLALDARGAYAAETLRIDALSLRSGATSATARGTAGRELALEWEVDSPDLGEVWPDLAGELAARGELRGPRERPHVLVDARGESLAFAAYAVESLELTADVDIAGEAHSSLTLSVEEGRVDTLAVPQLRVMAEGNAASHTLALSATTSTGDASARLSGSGEAPWTNDFAWRFELEEATLAYPELAPWTLRAPATGRVTRADAVLERSCWQSGAAELCAEGARDTGGARAQFALSSLPFDYFAPLLAAPARLEGDLSLEGTFQQPPNGTPELSVALRTSPGRLVSVESDADADPVALAFGPAEGRIALQDDRFEAELAMPFAEQGELAARARIGAGAGAAFGERTLDGELRIDIAALDFVSDVLREVQNTQGAVQGDLRFAGTVSAPRVAGTLALTGGRATLPATNVELTGVELALVGDGARGLNVSGEAQSGGGRVTVEGRVALAEQGLAGRIAIDGEALEVANTGDAQVAVSPDLDIAMTAEGIAVTGTVQVPRARLTPRDTGESAVAVSPDQIIVEPGDDAERQAAAQPLSANVRLVLGDDVEIDGYGLTGRLAGAIEITEKPGEPTAATGELRVEEGIYEAYGQQLEIETGRVVFAGGPVTAPGVDIRAVRRPAEGIVVGARVRGLLAAPELSLFSEPAMPEQEQLSYLVLGRPLDDVSESESSAMSRAALALGVRGGNFVSERINENLGLDAFGIETDPGEAAVEAAFVIGKYLTPSLYVSYGIGIFEPINTLKLRYAFSRRWRLETETSSEASGGDLIYNIERGR
jgi:translocation and assembly module TamB